MTAYTEAVYPRATQIPNLGSPDPKWLVELGPTAAERYYGHAPDEATAIGRARGEHLRRAEGV